MCIVGLGTKGEGRQCVYLFLILSVPWHICIPHLLSPLWMEIKNIREKGSFFESSSRLTIFISCSDSHESCHSCFSSTHAHGACSKSWRFPLKRKQWSESHTTEPENKTNTHRQKQFSIKSSWKNVWTHKSNRNRVLKYFMVVKCLTFLWITCKSFRGELTETGTLCTLQENTFMHGL